MTRPRPPLDAIGLRLREERLRLDMTQTELGALVGVCLRTQQSYELGRRAPNARYFQSIAAAGVDALYVLTGVRLLGVWRDDIAQMLRTAAETEPRDGEPAAHIAADPAAPMPDDAGELRADERVLLALFRRADLTGKMRAVAALDADAGRAAP